MSKNPAYYPEEESKIPIHLMEIERRKNFRFSEWAQGSGTPDTNQSEPKETETPILGISFVELHNELINSFIKTYSKHK
ncbi:hypothetical protein O181_123068 [Austropuccinia psidii MF-1]|uniref:Uncharacterized protein n=1 Tax=Austropuccinia psidii MF-1 TaxID=1389203 RepID=A0A9Q3Q2T3_9BASI|nr:hypothetical protein [Austropuccinia psidii MF-1]